MRYKIVKKSYVYNDKIHNNYYVMYETKVWWKKEPVWKYCKEFTYASYDSWIGDPVVRDTLEKAEEYIKLQMRINNGDFDPEDVKIYECRDSKLNNILND